MSSSLVDYRELIEAGLNDLLPYGRLRAAGRLNNAIRYAIFPGGKRMRPVLALLGAKVAGGDLERAMPSACATEFLHASSLIFDDLPAMDDADVRRARPALHLAFGEDVALLAALALLNQAYSIFGCSTRLIREATDCIGVNGMIGGQVIDLDIHSADASRNRKTTALLRLTLTAGAIACEATEEAVEALARCGELMGEAYQIYDDLLDEYALSEHTGKTARQDARHHRPSHLAEFGAHESCRHLQSLVAESKCILLREFGETEPVRMLISAIDSIVGSVKTSDLVMSA